MDPATAQLIAEMRVMFHSSHINWRAVYFCFTDIIKEAVLGAHCQKISPSCITCGFIFIKNSRPKPSKLLGNGKDFQVTSFCPWPCWDTSHGHCDPKKSVAVLPLPHPLLKVHGNHPFSYPYIELETLGNPRNFALPPSRWTSEWVLPKGEGAD